MIVNSGSLEDNSEEEIVDIFEPEADDLLNGVKFEDLPDRKSKIRKTASTDYGKVAKAIGDVMSAGIKVSLVDINKSDFGFRPDVENNQILFGMKAMLNVSDETVNTIIANRPYASPRDFLNKVKPNKQTMISLIKGGAFDKMMDRKECMIWYIWETCDKKKRLTLQNMAALIKYNLLPENDKYVLARRTYEFNRYLKAVCKFNTTYYKLDERALNFIYELNESIYGIEESINYLNGDSLFNIKDWDKFYQKEMDIFREWISKNKDSLLMDLNTLIFKEDWDKYAHGNISAWEMETLCFYYHPHELINVNEIKYGFSNFYNLPEEPVVDRSFIKNGKEVKIFKLSKICGTVIAKNKTKSTVTLLTTSGVVNIKFRKEYFSLFDKQISEKGEDGIKHVVERSWFNRGNMIIVMGLRSGDDFVVKKYASSQGHQLYRISDIDENNNLILQTERYKGEK